MENIESSIQTPNTQPAPSENTPEISQSSTPIPVKKPFPWLFVAVSIVLVAIVVIFLIKKIGTQSPNSQPPQATKSPTSTQSQILSAPNWPTYTNKSNNFSLQYPPTLQIKESSFGMGVESVELRSTNNLNAEYLADFQMLIISKVLGQTIGQDFDAYYNLNNNSTKTISADGKSRILTKTNNRSLDNLRAFDFKTTSDPPQADEEAIIGAYIEIDSNMIIISAPERYRKDLEIMLSSFVLDQ